MARALAGQVQGETEALPARRKGEELAALEKQVGGWNVIEEHHLAKTFTFANFREALKFVNRVDDSLNVVVQLERRPGRCFVSEVVEIIRYDPDLDEYDSALSIRAVRCSHERS